MNSHGLLTEFDLHLLAEGTHYRTFEKLGAHLTEADGEVGVHFAVWAPNAEAVSIIGDFNGWAAGVTPMTNRPEAGIWEVFVPGLDEGALYKFQVTSRFSGYADENSDPYAFASEIRPRTASKVWDVTKYDWNDAAWLEERRERNRLDGPISIYEVHLGSWMRVPEEENRWLTYRELAPKLAEYMSEMGFTHVEFLPVSEHPLDASWGYQTIGYFAPSSRYGTPDDFKFLIDTLHQHGIGVFIDWVPAHFPHDAHGLAFFDGTHLYEHADPRQGHHPDWNTAIFNYGRNEVSNFLISNALFWMERYHIDGLRVDAVASMLYLDYGRKEGEWIPNEYGGRENIPAIEFLRRFNHVVYSEHPDIVTAAEESTSWPMVSRPTYLGGLGFGLKWNMGWMNDMLRYMSKDPIHRQYHHNDITFSMLYAFHENFVLPFSHDEVVHGKGSMIGKMPGDDWQKFANLRLLYGYMYGHPGKKLLFMGNEIGQWAEWNHESSVEWHLLQYTPHEGLRKWVRDLNGFYRREPAMHEVDFDHQGFEWIDCNDSAASIISFLRWSKDRKPVLFVCNFTPVLRRHYRVGAPWGGFWEEVLNSDAECYGGSGQGNLGGVNAYSDACHGRPCTLDLTVPPLGMAAFRPVG